MGPLNYTMPDQNPFQSLAGGFQMGSQMAQAQALRQEAEARAAQQQQAVLQQRAAAEQAAAQQARMSALVGKVRDGQWTPADFFEAQAFAPKDQAEAINRVWTRMDEGAQKGMLSFGTSILVAAGRDPEAAKRMLQERAEASRNSNRRDEAKAYEDWAKALDVVGPEYVQTAIGGLIAGLPGGKDAIEGWNKAESERRAAALAPVVTESERRKGMPSSILEAIEFEKLTPSQQQTFKNTQILRQPVTRVEVSNIEKGASAELGKLAPVLYEKANAAVGQLNDIPRYRQALQSAIVGPGAEQRLVVARVASALGFTGDKAVNATTELIQGNAEMALNARSLLAGQGPITENEQKLLIKAKAGDITFTKGELETLFNVFERASRAQYAQNTKLLKAAATKSDTAQMFLDSVAPIPEGAAPAAAGDVRSRADQIIRGK